MTSVLTTGDVIDGVVASVLDDGPAPPTARRLASRLHVAPATLYSVFPSLSDAYSCARETMIEGITGPLVDALARGRSAALVDELISNPNRAVFLTDPTYPVSPNPMLANALERAGFPADALGDLLAIVGSLLSIRPGADHRVSGDAVDRLVGAYRHAAQELSASGGSEVISLPTIEPNDIDQVLRLIDQSIAGDEAPEPVRMTQRASARLVSDLAEPEWSFRELGRVTGIPVTRLHRYGTRLAHLSQTNVHVLTAAATWFPSHSALVAFLLESGASQTLIELYNDSRTQADVRQTPPFCEALGDTLEPSAVALIAACAARNAKPAETVALVDQFVASLAA